MATILLSVGLLTTSASVSQMLRGSGMVFSALFAVWFLKRRLNKCAGSRDGTPALPSQDKSTQWQTRSSRAASATQRLRLMRSELASLAERCLPGAAGCTTGASPRRWRAWA